MTNQQNHIKNLVLSALCLAIAMYLPFLTGQIQTIGNMLCPMHIPVFLCAYMCGWKWAAAVGFVSPFIRYSAFGMPPIMPVGIGMAFEMLTYGLVAGILYKVLPKKNCEHLCLPDHINDSRKDSLGYNAACHRRSCSRSVHLADVCERRGAYGSSGDHLTYHTDSNHRNCAQKGETHRLTSLKTASKWGAYTKT